MAPRKRRDKIEPQQESKRQKFERIAERRVNLTLKLLRLLGNLAERRNYDYSEAHVQQLFSAIDNEVRSMKGRFKIDTTEGGRRFKFGEE
jgi:hypothetical protein